MVNLINLIQLVRHLVQHITLVCFFTSSSLSLYAMNAKIVYIFQCIPHCDRWNVWFYILYMHESMHSRIFMHVHAYTQVWGKITECLPQNCYHSVYLLIYWSLKCICKCGSVNFVFSKTCICRMHMAASLCVCVYFNFWSAFEFNKVYEMWHERDTM